MDVSKCVQARTDDKGWDQFQVTPTPLITPLITLTIFLMSAVTLSGVAFADEKTARPPPAAASREAVPAHEPTTSRPHKAPIPMGWDDTCFSSKEIHLKVGGQLFSIPRRLTTGLYLTGEKLPKERITGVYCYRERAPPIDVAHFSFIPTDEFKPLGPDAAGNTPLPSFQILVYPASKVRSDAYYGALKDQLKKRSLKLKDLPIKDGFYVWKRQPGFVEYISKVQSINTSGQSQVVFNCRGQLCSVNLREGAVDYVIRMFSPEEIPLTRWKEFCDRVRSYMNSFKSGTITEVGPNLYEENRQ